MRCKRQPLCGSPGAAILAVPPRAQQNTEGTHLYTPRRLFGEVESSSDILTHEPFLERARVQREQADDGSARLALGAYVVARLVDKLLLLSSDSDGIEAFRWQLEAVRRHVSDLPENASETAHLTGIVGAIPLAPPIAPSLWKNLTAYAYFLDHDARLEESLEMLILAARAHGEGIPPSDFTAYALFAGRLNRQLARWDAATRCYSAAEEAATRIGEPTARLRGRLGRGAVLRGQGNLPQARAIAESVLEEATTLGLTGVQVIAYSDLGVLYSLQGSRLEGLEAHYRAFQLTTDPVERMRSLGDLALGLSEIGAYDVARIAFEIVAKSQARVLVRANALLELMDLESSVGNRVAFERWRAAVQKHRDCMSPSMSVDYNYKLGIGLARFGQTKRAEVFLTAALQLAEQHKLNAWYFKVENSIRKLREEVETPTATQLESHFDDTSPLREIELGLREYAAADVV
jgi:tetratricopeptide (TPR) repeat protein